MRVARYAGPRLFSYDGGRSVALYLSRTGMLEALLLSAFLGAPPSATPQDTGPDLRREADRAAFRYESLLRRRAPARFGGGYGSSCDEVIGRFCFHFTDGDPTAADTTPEPAAVTEARNRAILTHRAWLSQEPALQEAAGPLIRYLVEADRAGEAVPAARTHAWAADRTPESLLLLGLALHESGDFATAEQLFDSARAAMPIEKRKRLDDVRVLLDPDERRWYSRMTPDEREAYNTRLWRFSDPSLLEPGNERRSAHYARHAWALILEDAPAVSGRTSWSRDTEEILLRYGLPTRRERIREPTWSLGTDLSIVEVFDPHAVSFVPTAMALEGLPWPPAPGERGPMERDTVRSSYAPVRLHQMQELVVQTARFPTDSGSVLVVAGRMAPDSLSPAPFDPVGVLVVLDTMGREATRAPATVRVESDSAAIITARVEVGPGAWVYRLEVKDDSTGRGGLAQHRVDVESAAGLAVSDLLLAVGMTGVPGTREDLTPWTGAVLPTGAQVLIWAEVTGLTRQHDQAQYSVEWWVEDADPGTALGRAARWLGRKVGLVGERRPTRVRWDDRSARDPVPVTFMVELVGLDPGPYLLGLTVRDLVTKREATATRLVRLDPSAPVQRARSPD